MAVEPINEGGHMRALSGPDAENHGAESIGHAGFVSGFMRARLGRSRCIPFRAVVNGTRSRHA